MILLKHVCTYVRRLGSDEKISSTYNYVALHPSITYVQHMYSHHYTCTPITITTHLQHMYFQQGFIQTERVGPLESPQQILYFKNKK